MAIAAPFIPNDGTNNIFRPRLNAKIKHKSNKIIFDFPFIEIKLFDITKIEKKKIPKANILSEFEAPRYSDPKRTLIKNSGKNKNKTNKGKLIKKIHFPTW